MQGIARRAGYVAAALLAAALLGCSPPIREATSIVVDRQASKFTLAAEIDLPPAAVYRGVVSAIEDSADVHLVATDPGHHRVEARHFEERLIAEATTLRQGQTLLFIWADTGGSGRTGRDLAMQALDQLCSALGVAYQLVE